MKQIISFVVFITLLTSTSSFNIKNFGKERIEIVFTHSLKYDDLVSIKQTLIEKGISIEYRKLEFDKNGNLKRLEFFVDCKDGYSGSASTSKFSKDKKFGFYRDYDENSKTPFFIGFF